ncbi:hypothetical protein D7030_01335 [Flavobacteriaceae bacterium AU392]|nr:hypothetical protein D1817_07790 [Flavobacteriaceae bacterium]RKM86522.1 hypothetical protein D7030_01335 [Flavobacteriaceae bacterium AU392]
MKQITILLIVLISFNSFSQKKTKEERQQELEARKTSKEKPSKKSYLASNGVTYKVGEFYELNKGSDTNGKFVHANIGGWAISLDTEANRLPAANRGLRFKLKRIRRYNGRNFRGVMFTIGGGNITNYILDIEGAIETCEIKPCKEKTNGIVVKSDKYDQLAKLKELLDNGTLTKEEYETEKKKILNKD